jgi:hypothetical protein
MLMEKINMVTVKYEGSFVKELGIANNYQEAFEIMRKYLKEKEEQGFQWYYTRVWTTDNKTIIHDVGSHTEYILFVYSDESELMNDDTCPIRDNIEI